MNRKWLKFNLIIAVMTVLAVTAAVAVAHPMGPGGGWGAGMGIDNSLLAVVADALDMEQTALVSELQAGKTVAELAAAKDVTLDSIVDLFVAPHAEQMAAAVDAGRLTGDQVATMLAAMKDNVLERLSQPFDPNGFGFTDENGDGLCDLCGSSMGGMMGRGSMMGRGGMMGRGMPGRGGMGQGGMWGNQNGQGSGGNS